MTLNIDWATIAKDLEAAAAFVQSPAVTALASLGGPAVAGVTKTVQGLAAISSDLLATAQSAEAAIASGDLEKIKAADAVLQDQNATLAGEIAAS